MSWRPECAVCVLVGIRSSAADTVVSDTPVCRDHAGHVLAADTLATAVREAAADIGRGRA